MDIEKPIGVLKEPNSTLMRHHLWYLNPEVTVKQENGGKQLPSEWHFGSGAAGMSILVEWVRKLNPRPILLTSCITLN